MEKQGPLKSGEPGDHAEVRTHAPTLLGADQPGEQGEARVWAPSPWRRRARWTSLAGSAVILLLACWFIRVQLDLVPQGSSHHTFNGIILADLAFAAIILFYGWLQLRRPRYITTDNPGIGISGRRGGWALRWSDIRSARSVHYAKIALKTNSGPIKISLHAYTEGLAEDLFAVIVNRANLYRSPDDVYQFLPEDQVRERFLARGQNAVLERPPMPASRRFTNDTVAKRTFFAAVALMAAFAMAGIGLILWSHHTFGRVSLTAHDTLNYKSKLPAHAVIPWAFWGYRTYQYRTGNPDLWYDAMSSSHSTMFHMLFELRQPTNQAGSGNEPPWGYATIWLNQRLNTPLATPNLSGYRIGSITETWAPAEMKDAPSSLYRYDIGFFFAKGQKIKPAHIAVTLACGSHRTRYELGNPYVGRGMERCNYYLNSEESALKENGPVIGALPSPRTWRYFGISAPSVRSISGVRFEPAPAIEDFEPADGKRPAGAVAAWLPGRFTGDQLSCDLLYRDGGVRHLVLSPGVQVKGMTVIWQMPAKFEKELPEGPI